MTQAAILGLDREQLELQALAREFAEREIRPLAAHHDATEEFPWELVRKAAEIGIQGHDLPEDYGGGGITSLLTQCLICEELGWGDVPISGVVGGAGFFAETILRLGTEAQKLRWVPPLCGPEPRFGAVATTEPEAGSDAASIATHARRDGDGYVLNGQKTFISMAGIADYYLVFATVAPGTRSRGITAFVAEAGDPGLAVGPKMEKLGHRCIPTADVYLSDCRLDEGRRIGAEGDGFRGLMELFDRSRVILAAGEVGLGRAAVEYAVAYAKERRTWGRPIHEYQAVSFRLVDARLRVDQARLLTHQAARLADADRPFTVESAMAKLAASEAAWFAAWACCQTLGGYSYSREYPAEKWLRDAKVEEIWEGTSDIMRLIVSRAIFR